ncbi:hypothetical protein BDW22DRAFT_1480824 [Trametopsis cervina]|nr:hypothetical protein BDW22DRAFT_1480824 [Trametopsis cervina]
MASQEGPHRAILSEDIITLVFEYAAQADVTHYEIPMSISQTCRQWRQVALNITALWCRFDIVVDVRKWRRAPYVHLLQALLPRSKSHPLYFSLHFCANTLDGVAVSVEPGGISEKEARHRETYAANVMRLLLACQARWREATILFFSTGLPRNFTAKLHDTSDLEKLEVSYDVKGTRCPLFAEESDIGLVPIYALQPEKDVAFPRLKSLVLRIPGLLATAVQSLFIVLQHTPDIRTLLVSHHRVDMFMDLDARVVVPQLPHLREITWNVSAFFMALLLTRLHVPALQELHVGSPDIGILLDVCIRWLRMQRTIGRLTGLHMDFDGLSEFEGGNAGYQAMTILTDTMSLERLYLNEPFVGYDRAEAFWRLLAMPGHSGHAVEVCPALTFLSVKFSTSVPNDYKPFVQMLAFRARDERFRALVELTLQSEVSGMVRESMVEEAESFRAECVAVGLPVVEVDGSALQFRIPA